MKLSERKWKCLEIIFFWLLLHSDDFWKFRFIYKPFSVYWLLKLYSCHHYHKNYHKFSSLNTNVLLRSSTGQKSNRLGWFLYSGFHKAKPRWHRGVFSRGSREESIWNLSIGRIQFHGVVLVRVLFPCWLLAEGCSQLLEETHSLAHNPLPHLQSLQ